MEITLIKSPKYPKKFRVVHPDGTKTDFGLEPYTDYTRHKNPFRMRSYVQRHGGKIPQRILKLTDPKQVDREMISVIQSDKENWTKKGIKTAGFWSRWLLWSSPSLSKAIKIIENKFNVTIKYAGR